MNTWASELLNSGLRVVAVGGGSGLSNLLRALKRCVRQPFGSIPGLITGRPQFISEITAVVAAADEAGSNGHFCHELDMLPPGDLRDCMVALSDNNQLLTRLFSHRFNSGGELAGRHFGSIIIAALTEMTGDFAQAARLAADILGVDGGLMPATSSKFSLAASLEDGTVVCGVLQPTDSAFPKSSLNQLLCRRRRSASERSPLQI